MRVADNKRPRRTPINGSRNVLTVNGKEPGYQYRVVNDTGDRIQMFIDQGYEVVSDDKIKVGDRRIANPTKEGTPVQVSVGGGQKAFVMRIKDEYYQEDQAAKLKHVADLEAGMKKEASSLGLNGKLDISRD